MEIQICYEDSIELLDEEEELATKEITEQIQPLIQRGIYPNIGWEIWTDTFEEFTITRIIYAKELFQFYVE